MHDWSPHLRPRLASLQLNPAREAEIIEELSQHLDQRFQSLVLDGASEAEARRRALDELRDPGYLAHQLGALRQAHGRAQPTSGTPGRRLLPDLWHDLRYASRMLRRQPAFTAAAVLTLALGIGANTAIFSLVNATLLRHLPVADRHGLAYVYRGNVGGVLSYPMYASLRDGNHAFDGLAAWGGLSASLHTDDATDLVSGVIVTGNFFGVLGIAAEHGRLLAPSDDVTPGGHPVAVISHDFWQTRFAGRPDTVGQDIRLNGQVFTIVGVTPAGFPGPQLGVARSLYVPMMMQAVMRPPRAGYSGDQNPDLLRNANNGWLNGLGRLKPGVTIEQARGELAALATASMRATDPAARPVQMTLVPIDEGDPAQRGQMRSAALLLGGVVAAVLLIACANIANLLLSRTAARRRELAVRLAIGASRARLVRQLLTESLLLSLTGGAVGVALAWAAVAAFRATPPPPGALPVSLDFAIDDRVLWFSLGLSLLTCVAFGVGPALHASRPDVVPALRDAPGEADGRWRRLAFKQILVVAQVAVTLLLMIAAGLFVRSLQSAQAIDPGFQVEKLLSAPLNVNLLRYTRVQGREFYRQVLERVGAVPGVESATLARVALMTGGGRVLALLVEGRQGPDSRSMSEGGGVVVADPTRINANVVGTGFFRTLGIPLAAGRDFNDQDEAGRPPVVVLNETAVRMHFAGQSPIGKRVSFNGLAGPWCEIVGVARDSKYGALGEAPLPVVYLPVAQNHETGMILYVRASVPPRSLIAAIRREIQAVEPDVPVPDIDTMADTIGASLYTARMGAWLLGAFGALALLLAAVGIYGVLSFSISRRTREMGIRLALGADRGNVFLLVVRDGMLVVGVGIALGLAGGILGGRSLAGFLYGVPPSDVPTFAVMTTVLVLVALIACGIPARRAMRLNPLTALRYD